MTVGGNVFSGERVIMGGEKTQGAWRIRFIVPRAAVEIFETALDGMGDAFSCFEVGGSARQETEEGGRWQVELRSAKPFDMPRVHAVLALAARAAGVEEPAPILEREELRNWLQDNLQAFPPIRAGRFFVRGSHWTAPPPSGCIPLIVDAATAFGSGEHQSTYGCLLALDGLARRGAPLRNGAGKALDMGCGSGILSLAIARRWKMPVVAADIDEESVRVTRVNARLNGVASLVRAFCGDGFRTLEVGREAPYDVICANILARPLCRMARDFPRSLAPGGRVILAGLLERQEPMVLAAYRMQGLRLKRRIALSPWATLVLG